MSPLCWVPCSCLCSAYGTVHSSLTIAKQKMKKYMKNTISAVLSSDFFTINTLNSVFEKSVNE